MQTIKVDARASPARLSPEYSAGLFSKIFFQWVNSFFVIGNKRPLEVSDLFKLAFEDDVATVSNAFELRLAEKLKNGTPQPVRASIVEQFKKPMIIAGIVKFFNSTSQFGPPLLLNGLLNAIADRSSADPQHPVWVGYAYALGLCSIMVLRVLIENNYFHRVMRVGFRIRCALSAAVYRKSLRMSPVARQDTPVGKIVNLMQLDASRLESLTTQIHVIWDSPYQILGYMVLLGVFLGWSALAGLASMVLLIPLQMFFMKRMGRRRQAIAKATDQRVKVTNEALQGVRTLKQYNWEDAYNSIISKVRDVELDAIWKYNLVGSWNNTLMQVAPLIVGVVTLLVYAGSGGVFTAARIFSALSTLNSLRFPLLFLPSVIQQLADAKVSLGRLDKFLLQPEVEAFTDVSTAIVTVHADESGPSESKENEEIPERLRGPMVSASALQPAQMGIAVIDATFFHEAPLARAKRIADNLAEKQQEEAARKKSAPSKSNAPAPLLSSPVVPSSAPDVKTTTVAVAAQNAVLPPVLVDVNIVIPKGKLYAIIGAVGTGKSSLCTSILGELHRAAGSVSVHGRIAYVAQVRHTFQCDILFAYSRHSLESLALQSAWILNASVRKNITFAGEAAEARRIAESDGTFVDVLSPDCQLVDEARYDRTMEVCQLAHDVSTLSHGDRTEIGERGINLSGGQKQRVSIVCKLPPLFAPNCIYNSAVLQARAAYANADVYIFDDPLSALDAEVGKAVFNDCITGMLASKTRLLVTNQLQYLAACDGVIVLGQHQNGSGYVKYQGIFEDLLHNVPEFEALMSNYGHKKSGTGDDKPAELTDVVAEIMDTPNASVGVPAAKTTVDADKSAAATSSALMTLEEKSEGAVKLQAYLRYLRSAGNVWLIFTVLFLAYLFGQLSQLAVQWWLTYWTSDTSYIQHPMGLYMGVYVCIAASAAVFGFIRVVTMACMGIRASRSLHRDLVTTILHAPQSFFDTTPLGRILARFSKDFDAIDNQLMGSLGMLGMCIFFVFGSLVAIIFATPWFALVVLPVSILYVYVMNYFRNVARESKRFDALTRSPIFAHFSETLNGLSTIRAYGMVAEFAAQNAAKLTTNVSAWYTLRCCDRWLSIRLEALGNLVILAASLLAVGTGSNRTEGNAAGLAGFSLSYAIAITGLLNWLVRTFTDTEQTMNSVERVLYYKDNVPQEPYDPPANADPLPPSWPASGSVVFKDYHMRYRETTPEVLHGVSFAVRGGEKIGIVGRTGT
jgi:ATP-binding cassette subfamily C (CFTR/MRP) protein 1